MTVTIIIFHWVIIKLVANKHVEWNLSFCWFVHLYTTIIIIFFSLRSVMKYSWNISWITETTRKVKKKEKTLMITAHSIPMLIYQKRNHLKWVCQQKSKNKKEYHKNNINSWVERAYRFLFLHAKCNIQT